MQDIKLKIIGPDHDLMLGMFILSMTLNRPKSQAVGLEVGQFVNVMYHCMIHFNRNDS